MPRSGPAAHRPDPLHGAEYLGNARMIQRFSRPAGEFYLGMGREEENTSNESPLEGKVSVSFHDGFLAV